MVVQLNQIETTIINVPAEDDQIVRIEIKETQTTFPDGFRLRDLGEDRVVRCDWRRIREIILSHGPNAKVHLVLSDRSIKTLGCPPSFNMVGALFQEMFQNTRLWKVTMPYIEYVGNKAFGCCHELVECDFSSAKFLGAHCFINCSQLARVVMPQLTSMGVSSFENCASVTYLYLPSVVKVGLKSCENMTSLKYAYMPKADIGNVRTFRNCHNLRHVHIDDINYCDSNTFENCHALNVIVRHAMKIKAQDWFKPYRMEPTQSFNFSVGHHKLVLKHLRSQTAADNLTRETFYTLVMCLKLCGMQKDGRARAKPLDPIMKILTGPAQDVARTVIEFKYGTQLCRKNGGELRWKDIWVIRNTAIEENLLLHPQNKDNFNFWGAQVNLQGEILGKIRKRVRLVHFNELSDM